MFFYLYFFPPTPNPLLVGFAGLLISVHNVRLQIGSQVRLSLLPVLDQERFRVFAVGASQAERTTSVQRVLLVGIRLDDGKDDKEN